MDKKELAAKELRHQYERFCDYYKHCQSLNLDLRMVPYNRYGGYDYSNPPSLSITDRKIY